VTRIAIINGDEEKGTVHVDGRSITFSFDGLIPDDNIWAAHWYGYDGDIEYKKGMPDKIIDFSIFDPIIEKYDELIALTDAPVHRSLLELQLIKISQINTAASKVITSGFNSSALGSTYLYASDRDSQTNLIGIVQVANLNNSNEIYPCENESGAWDRLEHTPQQLAKVLTDGKDRMQAIKIYADGLKSQANSANSEADLNLIQVDFSTA
jgi:hypothetical protein